MAHPILINEVLFERARRADSIARGKRPNGRLGERVHFPNFKGGL